MTAVVEDTTTDAEVVELGIADGPVAVMGTVGILVGATAATLGDASTDDAVVIVCAVV